MFVGIALTVLPNCLLLDEQFSLTSLNGPQFDHCDHIALEHCSKALAKDSRKIFSLKNYFRRLVNQQCSLIYDWPEG